MEFAFAQRFASVFGTPNVATPGNYCGVSRLAGASFTFGFQGIWDAGPETGVIVIWGYNGAHIMGGYIVKAINSALKAGAKLVVLDPKKIDSAKKADLWIRPRPGSDGVLALGIIKILIEEKLYDADFVADWTIGFKELSQHISTFALEEVKNITWVPIAQMRELAKLISKYKPLCLLVGNGLERSRHSFQQMRALFIMRSLVGALNKPGGNIALDHGPYTRPGRFYQLKGSPRVENISQGRVVGKEFKLAMTSAYIPTQSLITAILEEKPNPIKAGICILSNPVISYPDSLATYEAIKKLEFFVVSELFPTPTTALADIILPAAWQVEHETLGYWPGWFGEIRAYPKLVDPPGEARADIDWLNELAQRVGLGKYFWKSARESLEHMLEPSNVTYKELIEQRVLKPDKKYRSYEEGIFKTPSGKVEFYSEQLEKMGFNPIPYFAELSQFHFQASDKYPLLLFNGKEGVYMLTGYKHIKSYRKMKPQPTVELNPQTAKELNLVEGDWVYIETEKGRIKQVLALDSELDPRLVNASFGWWFPEEEEDLYQFKKSNINLLIENKLPFDGMSGSPELGGIPCRVYKA